MSTNDRDLRSNSAAPDLDDNVAPGRGTLTSRLVPPSRQTFVFRVESAEAANALADRFVQRDANGVAAGADVAVDRAASSSGSPLPGGVKEQFEGSTGADLSGVRVHTGAESAAAASAVGAHAYTTGQDIHFGAGKFAPSDPFGLHLLAHEVAHTVQQQDGAASGRQHKLEVSSPDDALEVEADRAADAMVSGAPAAIGGGKGSVARKIMREGDGSAAPAAAAPAPEGGGEAKKEGGPGVGGGASVDGNKLKLKLAAKYKSPPVKIAALRSTVEGEASFGGDLTVEAASDADKDKKPEQGAAEEGAKGLATELFKAEHDPAAAVQSIELGVEGGKEVKPKDGQAGFSVGVGVTVKLRGGAEVKGVANLVKAGTTKDGFDISILELEASEKFPIATLKDKVYGGFKFNGGLNIEFKFTIKPDKAALLAEAVKKLAPEVVGKAAGTVGKTIAEVSASLPALVGIVGGYITIKSMLASLADWDDMKAVAAAAEKAVQGYAGGFSVICGGKNVMGDPVYNVMGIGDGNKAISDQISKIQNDPQFKDYNFTSDEIRTALTDRVKQTPDAIYDEAYQGSRVRIKETFLQKWKSQLTTLQKTFTPVEGDEQRLRAMMGI